MKIGDRVQIPAYTDHWMRGNRYGAVRAFKKFSGDDHNTYAIVDLDIAKKKAIVLIDDCEVIE